MRLSCQTRRPPKDCQIVTPINATGKTVTARLATRSTALPAAGMPAVYELFSIQLLPMVREMLARDDGMRRSESGPDAEGTRQRLVALFAPRTLEGVPKGSVS
jgi:hypothetical protein